MAKTKFVDEEFYHIYNRGVEKRRIFNNETDYRRFLFGLFLFNDNRPVLNAGFYSNYRDPISMVDERELNLLVDIFCFCLMHNHFHLVLRQKVDGGISKFLQKLGIGYTGYFNLKYDRSGVLFQGKPKAIHIDNDRYLKHLSRYIHLNPLEIIEPEWKSHGVKNWSRAKKFLDSYEWSSYGSYLGRGDFDYLLNLDLLREIFGENFHKDYKKFVKEWTQKDLKLLRSDLTSEIRSQ